MRPPPCVPAGRIQRQRGIESIAVLRRGASSVYFQSMLCRERIQTGVPFLTTSLVVRTRIECQENPAARQAGPPQASVSLEMMASATAWTQAFGDACLAQRDQVMDAVQCLRQKARQAGSLRSDAQLTVSRGPSIEILPIDPVLYPRAVLHP